MDSAPVEATRLERRFGARRALAGVDVAVGAGEIVGLVGPNGSGKTTLLRILAGLLRPSAGDVRVFGHPPFEERASVMERARFAFAPPALIGSLTAREHLTFLARMRTRRMPRVETRDVERALALVGLTDRADDRVHAFSFGMRQRLVLAQALLPMPELLVLDEPTDGLDPLAVLELRSVLSRLRAEHGLAILLSSHLLLEVDQLVDRMLALQNGAVLFDGAPAELCAGSERLVLAADDPIRARELLTRRGIDALEAADGELELEPDAIRLADAAALFAAGGVELVSYHVRAASLEQALLARLKGGGGAE